MNRHRHSIIRELAPGVAAALLIALSGCGGRSLPPGAPEACLEPGGCAVFEGDAPVVIAVGGPMSGDNSAFGVDATQAAQLAVFDAGEIAGHPFDVRPFDDLGTGEGGERSAAMVANYPEVVAVMGHAFSGATSKAMGKYESLYLPMMSGSATLEDLDEVGNASFNRLISADGVEAVYVADFLANRLGAQRVAIIHDGTSYGRPIAEGVRGRLLNLEVQIAGIETLDPGYEDYSAVLQRVAETQPDAIFYGGYQVEAGVLVRQMHQLGLEVPFVGGSGVFGEYLITLVGQDAEGVYVISYGAPLSEARSKFDADFQARFGKPAGEATGFAWFYYDATMVLIEAVRDVAIESGGVLYVPRQRLVSAVRRTQGYQGMTGEVTCDANGECAADPTFVVFQVRGGEIVQLPEDGR